MAAVELLGAMAGALVDEAAIGVELTEDTAGTVVVIVTVEEADAEALGDAIVWNVDGCCGRASDTFPFQGSHNEYALDRAMQ